MTGPTTAAEINLNLAQIFLDEAEFRHRGDALADVAPAEAQTAATVTIDMRLSSDGQGAAIRLRVMSDAPDAPYFYSVTYVALFTFEATMIEGLQERLMVTGASMLLPFVRELVANLSSRGRRGPNWLAPVNFSEIVTARREATPALSP